MKTSTCSDGTPQKPNKQDRNDTAILSHHSYIFSILPTIHTIKLCTCTLAYSHPLNKCITTHQQGHSSLPNPQPSAITRQPLSAMFGNDKSSQQSSLEHAILTQHCLCIPQLLHKRQMVSAMHTRQPCSLVAAIQNITLCTSTCIYTYIQHYTHSTAFHNHPMHATNKHKI